MIIRHKGKEYDLGDIRSMDNVKYSFECSGLIKEIKLDIEYYNPKKRCYLYYIYIEGHKVYVDYALDEDMESDKIFNTLDGEAIETSTLEKALEILEEQNRII